MYKQVYYTASVSTYINKIVDRQYITNKLDSLEDITKTLVITSKEDYIQVSSLFPHKNIKILNKDTLLTLCYSNNYSIIPKKFYKNKIALRLYYYENIIENENETLDNKYFYTISEAVLRLHKSIGLTKKNSNTIDEDKLYIAITNLQPKGSLSKKDFERKYNSFINSSFVYSYNTKNFTIKTKDEIIFKDTNHNIYTDEVITRDTKYNIHRFTKYCVEYSYAKPLALLKDTHEVKTLSLSNVAKKLGMTASNVEKHTKDLKKLYKFEVVTELEYKEFITIENKERDTFIFPIYSNQEKLNKLTGEVTRKTYYFKIKGTKLLSNLKYKSFVCTDKGRKIKLSATVHTRASILAIASKENFVNIVKDNNLVELFRNISELDELENSTEDSIEPSGVDEITNKITTNTKEDMNLIVQFVGRNLKVIKEKLLLLVSVTELNGNIQNAKKLNRKFVIGSISDFIQKISYKTFNTFKHIGELEENSFETKLAKDNYYKMISIVYSINKKVKEFKLKNSKDNLLKINKSLTNIESKIIKYSKEKQITLDNKINEIQKSLDFLSKDIFLSFSTI